MHIYKTTTGNSIIQPLQQLTNIRSLLSLKKVSLLTYDHLCVRSSSSLPVSAKIYNPDCNICPSSIPLSLSVLDGFSWESVLHSHCQLKEVE